MSRVRCEIFCVLEFKLEGRVLLGNGVIPVSDGLLDNAGLLLQVHQRAPQLSVLLLQQGVLVEEATNFRPESLACPSDLNDTVMELLKDFFLQHHFKPLKNSASCQDVC